VTEVIFPIPSLCSFAFLLRMFFFVCFAEPLSYSSSLSSSSFVMLPEMVMVWVGVEDMVLNDTPTRPVKNGNLARTVKGKKSVKGKQQDMDSKKAMIQKHASTSTITKMYKVDLSS
jgi:hypothetical protein